MRPYTDHAADQLAERYGFVATEDEWQRAVLDIIDVVGGLGARALLLRRQGNGRELWLARLAGRPMRLVYQPALAMFITVLPENDCWPRS